MKSQSPIHQEHDAMARRQYCFELIPFPEDANLSLLDIMDNYRVESDCTAIAAAPDVGKMLEGLLFDRMENGILQSDVAKAMGLKKAALSRIENSNVRGREVAFSTLRRYADALGYELYIACIPKSEKS